MKIVSKAVLSAAVATSVALGGFSVVSAQEVTPGTTNVTSVENTESTENTANSENTNKTETGAKKDEVSSKWNSSEEGKTDADKKQKNGINVGVIVAIAALIGLVMLSRIQWRF